MQSRYYNAGLGRFNAPDAFASTGRGILGNNMYAYCNNNPVNYTDSSGFCGLCVANDASDQFSMIQICEGAGSYSGTISGGVAIPLPVSWDLIEETAAIVKDIVATLTAETKRGTHHVYVLFDPTSNTVKYIGRTIDPVRREWQHKHDVKHQERRNYDMQVKFSQLTYEQAKLFEQVLISAYTLLYLENARREIAVNNTLAYKQYLQSVAEIFVGTTEQGLFGLIGG